MLFCRDFLVMCLIVLHSVMDFADVCLNSRAGSVFDMNDANNTANGD